MCSYLNPEPPSLGATGQQLIEDGRRYRHDSRNRSEMKALGKHSRRKFPMAYLPFYGSKWMGDGKGCFTIRFARFLQEHNEKLQEL